MESNLNSFQKRNRGYNLFQTEVGHPLKTLKGSTIKRHTSGVGKVIGRCIYFHAMYYNIVLPQDMQSRMMEYSNKVPFYYNVIRYNKLTKEIAYVECPKFSEDREPEVGRMFLVDISGETKLTRYYQQVYHHKWTFVSNGCSLFDVAESWKWSRKWLSAFTEKADGSCLYNWIQQLKKFDLE